MQIIGCAVCVSGTFPVLSLSIVLSLSSSRVFSPSSNSLFPFTAPLHLETFENSKNLFFSFFSLVPSSVTSLGARTIVPTINKVLFTLLTPHSQRCVCVTWANNLHYCFHLFGSSSSSSSSVAAAFLFLFLISTLPADYIKQTKGRNMNINHSCYTNTFLWVRETLPVRWMLWWRHITSGCSIFCTKTQMLICLIEWIQLDL